MKGAITEPLVAINKLPIKIITIKNGINQNFFLLMTNLNNSKIVFII